MVLTHGYRGFLSASMVLAMDLADCSPLQSASIYYFLITYNHNNLIGPDINNTLNHIMDILKAILPDTWYMNLFSPEEDATNRLYLHIKNNTILRITQGVSRVDVVDFLKSIHESSLISENEAEVAEIRNKITTLFDVSGGDKAVNELMGVIPDLFSKEQTVFVSGSEMKVYHYKNYNGKWITRILKETGTKEIEIGVICDAQRYY